MVRHHCQLGTALVHRRSRHIAIAGLSVSAALAVIPLTVQRALAQWSAPEAIALSSPAVETANVGLVTNSAGDAVAGWREGSNVVRVAGRPANGPFASSQTLDASTGSYAANPRLGLGPDGRAMVVWFSNAGGRKLRYADRDGNAPAFGASQDVFAPGEDLNSLDVVIDAGGATHVAYNGPGYVQYPRVWTRTRGPLEASFGAESSLTSNLSPGSPGRIVLGTAADGSSVLTYYTPSADVAPGSQQQHIEGAVRAQGDAGWTLPAGSAHDWFCCLSLGPQGVSALGMDAAGNSYLVVYGVNDFGVPALPGPNFVLVGKSGTVVQGRQQLDPSWSNAGAGGTNGGDPQLAVDPAGNAWVAWAKQVGDAMTLYTAFRAAGAASTFSAPRLLAADLGGSFGGTFKLAATPGGAVAVWQGACGAGGCDLRAAVTGAASGLFGAAETLTAATQPGQGLQLAQLPADQALVVYRKTAGDLEARTFVPPPLRSMRAPLRRSITAATTSGIPVTVDVGVAGSVLKVRLLDKSGALDLALPYAAQKTKRDVARRRYDLNLQLTAEAAQKLASVNRVTLTVRVTVVPPGGPAQSDSQRIVLRQ